MVEQSAGLMGSVRRLLGTLSAMVAVRLELLSNELQEERIYLTRMLIISIIALSCFGLAVLLLTAFVVVLFWDEHRLAVLATLSGSFFVVSAFLVMVLRNKARAKPKFFAASLAELNKDREQLGGQP